MKAFFEEYGYVMLAAVVVLVLLGMVKPIGAKVQSTLEKTVDTFDSRLQSTVSETFPGSEG